MKALLLAAAVLGIGCGTSLSEIDEHEDVLGDDSLELSSTKDTFLVARRDVRRCIYPLCGGYWVKDLNSTMQERYVSGFDFSGSTLSEEAQGQVAGAPDFELVLEGRLGKKENLYNTRPLSVIGAYRGMPGKTFAATDKFYAVFPTKIGCPTGQPCAYLQTTRLNRTTGHTMATDVSVARALATRVDERWLHGRVLSSRAVVAGKIIRANKHITVDASQVFVALPDRVAACPPATAPACPSGKIRAYECTADRCTVPLGCTYPGACAPFEPTCDPGYTLIGWTNICPRHACEPDFLQ
jgi:hypothetical protein